jgi:hypothetical protein
LLIYLEIRYLIADFIICHLLRKIEEYIRGVTVSGVEIQGFLVGIFIHIRLDDL